LFLTGLFLLLFSAQSFAEQFSLRRHDNVTSFYQKIAEGCIGLGVKYKVPPAAVLAIAGLESGYGSGYVSQVSGNILSLGAKGDDAELPPLTLARDLKTRKLHYDFEEISKLGEGNYKMEKRPASLKKDYRPSEIAGTTKNLAFLKYNPDKEYQANMQCIDDFMNKWLSANSRSSVYRAARFFLDQTIEKHGDGMIFDPQVNRDFIYMIGGRPNSFNYRKTWPPKVINIMNKAGLVELCINIGRDNMGFAQAWGHSLSVEYPTRSEAVAISKPKKPEARTTRKIQPRVTVYDQVIENIARYNSIPAPFLIAMIETGSAFNKNKISSDRRYGLMQISVAQAQAWAAANYYTISSVDTLLEPTLNVRIGAWCIAQARNYWSSYGTNAYSLALCEYKTGRNEMMKYIAYDKAANKLVIREKILYAYVNGVIRQYSSLKRR